MANADAMRPAVRICYRCERCMSSREVQALVLRVTALTAAAKERRRANSRP